MIPTSTAKSPVQQRLTWPQKLAYTAAGLFTVASGGTNLIYGLAKGTDPATSLVWGAVSVGVSIIFSLSFPGIISASQRREWAQAVVITVALALSGAYSLSAALGSASGGRAAATATEQASTDTRAKAQSAWDAAKADLEKLTATNPTAELDGLIADARNELTLMPSTRSVAELSALVASAERCGPGAVRSVQGTNASRTVCRASSSLTAELGRAHTREALTAKITGWNSEKGTAEQRHADRREKLQTAMDKAAADLTAAKPMKQANSDAAALVGYLAAIGVNATPDTVNKWLVILAVLVVEMGGGLSLAIGMALSDSGVRSGQADRANVQVEQSVNEQPAERPNTAPERTVKNTSSCQHDSASSNPERTTLERSARTGAFGPASEGRRSVR